MQDDACLSLRGLLRAGALGRAEVVVVMVVAMLVVVVEVVVMELVRERKETRCVPEEG